MNQSQCTRHPDFFGSHHGDAFMKVWKELIDINVDLNVFFKGSWWDPESLNEAKKLASEKKDTFIDIINRLDRAQQELSSFERSVTKYTVEWNVVEEATAMRSYIVRHLLAGNQVETGKGYDVTLLNELDNECVTMIDWIEKDWDRNRYADDPNKNGIYVPSDHILYRFKKMHEFHQKLLQEAGKE